MLDTGHTADTSATPFRVELEPEVLLPSQYFTNARQDASMLPEKRLLLAVLEEAVGDFQRDVVATAREPKRRFEEAEAWIASDESAWPCSFVAICHALGLEVGWIRHGLWRWRDAQRARAARGEPLVRMQLRRVAGTRSRTTGRAALGRRRSRWVH
jgi:hypothetical protein